MKKIYLFLLVCLPMVTYSQARKRCGTAEYLETLKQNDPSVIAAERIVDQNVEQWIARHASERGTTTVITIPVVVHVLYHTPQENISYAQIQSQIDVLNEDFGKMNSDTNLVPAVWKPLVANVQIQFTLAQRDPGGNWTNGVERRSTTNASWSNPFDMSDYSMGGLAIWDRNSYMNFWVGNIGGGILGITQPPGTGPASSDGMCILFNAFGRVGTLGPPYDKGRTATHETGHWFGLHHIWGDDNGACTGSDLVGDTPNQAGENYGCPAFPHLDACSTTSPGVMWMNYMDYTDDACMYMFTQGQSTRINAILNTSRTALLTSMGGTLNGIHEINLNAMVNIYPNPASSSIHIDSHFGKNTPLEITVNDLLGNVVLKHMENIASGSFSLNVENIANGIYTVSLRTPEASSTQRINIQH